MSFVGIFSSHTTFLQLFGDLKLKTENSKRSDYASGSGFPQKHSNGIKTWSPFCPSHPKAAVFPAPTLLQCWGELRNNFHSYNARTEKSKSDAISNVHLLFTIQNKYWHVFDKADTVMHIWCLRFKITDDRNDSFNKTSSYFNTVSFYHWNELDAKHLWSLERKVLLMTTRCRLWEDSMDGNS